MGHRLSMIGERVGIEVLVYNPFTMLQYDAFGARDAPGFVSRLCAVFGVTSYLDVGAGTGRFAQELRRRGARADACEYNFTGRLIGAWHGINVAPLDLSAQPPTPLTGPYDVAVCLEVAEHLPAALGALLVRFLSGFRTVVLTAAPPGQGGTGHLNEQPKSYWESLFAAHGRPRDGELERRFLAAPGETNPYLLDNLMIFSRVGDQSA
jgi:hypothetical protein